MIPDPNRPATALITGGASGIGRAIVKELTGRGHLVAAFGRDRAKLAALAAEEPGVETRTCDVTDRAQVKQEIAEVLERLGRIDVLVCNAGANIPNRALATLEPADWDRMIATNLTGAYNVIHEALPAMRASGGGLIVQICSISGLRPGPLGGIAYSAAKAGQAALGIVLGREERAHGIRSTVIYPGEVDTPILEARPKPVDAERRALILAPEDVAAAVGFVAGLPPRVRVPELVILPAVDDWV